MGIVSGSQEDKWLMLVGSKSLKCIRINFRETENPFHELQINNNAFKLQEDQGASQ